MYSDRFRSEIRNKTKEGVRFSPSHMLEMRSAGLKINAVLIQHDWSYFIFKIRNERGPGSQTFFFEWKEMVWQLMIFVFVFSVYLLNCCYCYGNEPSETDKISVCSTLWFSLLC